MLFDTPNDTRNHQIYIRNTPDPGSPNTTFPQIASSIGRGACALWSLSAGAALGGCRRQMCGCVRFGAWALLLLQGAAARCVAACALELGRSCCCKVPLPDVWLRALWSLGALAGRVRVGAWVLVSLLWCCLLVSFALWGLCWRHFFKVKATASLQLSGEEGQ